LKISSDQIQRLAENRVKSTGLLENNQKRMVDLNKSSEQMKETIEETQLKVDGNRVRLAEVQIETEQERYFLPLK
jgi:chromosome segregation ATPase